MRALATLLLVAFVVAGCDTASEPSASAGASAEAAVEASMAGFVLVANRAGGTVSVISTDTDRVVRTVALPQADGEPLPEPMYIVYDAPSDRVFVGDRANARVVAYDATDGSVAGTAPAGGVFHMWADPQGAQLWVVDNVDNAMTVIDPASLDVLATVPVTGGTPHDTVLDPDGAHAYVSVFVDDGADQVVKYSTATFAEVARVDVGEDPHLSATDRNGLLYVPCQNSDVVIVLDRATLAPAATLDVPGAHGAAMALDGEVFLTTNLPGGGTEGLFAIATDTNALLGHVDTPPGAPIPTPHNIVAPAGTGKVYVTHSGMTATQTTVYDLGPDVRPRALTTGVVEVGLNPFGIAYVPRR